MCASKTGAKEAEPRGVSEHAFAGACAGVVGTVLGFPLDTLKTRLQSQVGLKACFEALYGFENSESIQKISHFPVPAHALGNEKVKFIPTVAGAGNGKPGLGAVDMAFKIFRSEGLVRGFYRGMGPPLAALTVLNTASFSCYNTAKRHLGVQQVGPVKGPDGETRFVWDGRVILAGTVGAPLGSLLSTPLELLKVQVQLDNVSAKRYQGSSHAARCIVREHGIRGLYLGHMVNTSREVLFLAAYFGTYEHSRAVFEKCLPRAVAVPVAGGISGAAAWFLSYPLDCIKANIQGQRLDQLATKPRLNFWVAARQIYHSKGIVGMFAGVGPSIARAFLVSGSRFSAYEGAVWIIGNVKGDFQA